MVQGWAFLGAKHLGARLSRGPSIPGASGPGGLMLKGRAFLGAGWPGIGTVRDQNGSGPGCQALEQFRW
jgi:hypothetical protein